jgi:hypothetical protein
LVTSAIAPEAAVTVHAGAIEVPDVLAPLTGAADPDVAFDPPEVAEPETAPRLPFVPVVDEPEVVVADEPVDDADPELEPPPDPALDPPELPLEPEGLPSPVFVPAAQAAAAIPLAIAVIKRNDAFALMRVFPPRTETDALSPPKVTRMDVRIIGRGSQNRRSVRIPRQSRPFGAAATATASRSDS